MNFSIILLGVDRSYSACEKLMDIFRTCMADLCVPLAEEKTEGPKVLCFLGLELDSIRMVLRIPKDKIEELVEIRGPLVLYRSPDS